MVDDWSPSAGPRQRSVRRRAAAGALWVSAETWAQQILQFAAFAVLSRLLGPQAYGLISLALIVNVVGDVVITNGGWGDVLVRRPDLDGRHTSAVFWLLLGLGGAFWLLAAGLALPVAALFEEPAMAWLMPALALDLPLAASIVVPSALLRRELRFAPLVVSSTIALGIASGAAIWLAAAGAGVWGLVALQLLQPLVLALLLWLTVRWRPRLTGWRAVLPDLLPFVVGVLGARLIVMADALVIRLAVGWLLGTVALGQYTLARKVSELLAQLVSRPIARVMLPIAALLGRDRERLAKLVAACVHMIGLGTFPAALGLLVLAPDFVRLVFGAAWMPAVPLLQLLLLSALGAPFIQLCSSLVYAAGRAGLQAALTALSTMLLIGLLSIFGISSLISVGAALLARSLLMLPLRLGAARSASGIDVPRLCATALPSLAVALLMAGLVWWLRRYLPQDLAPALSVMLTVAAGVAIYLAFTLLLARDALRRVAELRRSLTS